MKIVREIPKILQLALKNGGDFAELFIEERFSVSIGCEANKIERVISGTDRGAGLRVVVGDMTAYASTNQLTAAALRDLAERVSKGIRAPVQKYTFPEAVKVSFEKKRIKYPSAVPASEKVSKVLEANETAWSAGKEVVQVLVRYGDSRQRVIIANSSGLLVTDERDHIIFLVHSVAKRGDLIQTGYEPVGGTMGFEMFEDTTPAKVARTAAEQALRMLDASPAPTGIMPVVVGAEAGGTMIHEAVGHGLEADLVQKGLSVFAGKIGQRIASESVSVHDDATIPRRRGTFKVDDEGTPAERTVLVENGVLKSYLYDVIGARKEGRASTGNGRRESYRHRPIPRMTNTLIVPGGARPEDVISATDKGLFVRRMGGGQVNTVSGDFMFEVSEGYLIRNGEIKEPVRGASLIGNSLKVLSGIDMVANDLGFGLGTCGKDGQGAPVSDAQPTLRIRGITVGGTSA
ncbi:MAG: TldD/PmbA family protein [Candidatus Abyssobacteria bacterium SURF_5]|uniref:TldD/PmbA family protein n=1 Tax=Abyssobacteria bacterium (strain SURF_5) TaxID=2093360 RepID=A0A3A4N2P7_ABYX5|nr:MAG: TldD/PmbA family protein [Candidatus Abyssubacteria bacterium SURF_5]